MQEGEENQGVPLSLSILVREAAVLSLPRLQVLSPTLGIVHRVDCISARDKTHTHQTTGRERESWRGRSSTTTKGVIGSTGVARTDSPPRHPTRGDS